MNILAESAVKRNIVPTDMAQKKKVKAPQLTEDEAKMWVIEPPDDLRGLMRAALKATGKDRRSLIIQCIKEELPSVVEKLLEEQKKAEQEFRSAAASIKPKPDTK